MPKIRIKSGAANPTTLNVSDSELAFARTGGKLFIGKGSESGGAATSVVEIGPLTVNDKTEKTTVVGDDLILIEDSAASNAQKKVKRSTLVGGLASTGAIGSSGLTQSTARMLGRTTASTGAVEEIEVEAGLSLSAQRLAIDLPGLTAKSASAADNDLILIADSANSNALRKITRANLVSGVGGNGTVTSVGMTVPSIMSVSGSPITGSGTLAVSLATQQANRIFAGPGTGSDAAPTFRSLVSADLPDIDGGTY